MTRTRQLITGLAALLALTTLLAGIPWALWHYIGWPLPHAVPDPTQLKAALSASAIPATVLLKALALVVWAGWAVLTASVLTETTAAFGGRPGPRIPLAGPLQPVAGRLVTAVAVAVFATLPRPASTSAPPLALSLATSTPYAAAHSLVVDGPVRPSLPGIAATATVSASPSVAALEDARLLSYRVQRRDTLWGIAQTQLGDPSRWREIFALNTGRGQPGGAALTDPNRIWPGWTLLLPPPHSAPAPPRAAAAPALANPSVPSRRMPAPQSPTKGSPAIPEAPELNPVHPPVAPSHTPASDPPAVGSNGGAARSGWLELDSGSRVAASFAAGVVAALGAARLRRRRRYQPRPPEPGLRLTAPPPSPTLRDLLATTRHHPSHGTPSAVEQAGEDIHPKQMSPAALVAGAASTQTDLIDVGTRDGQVVPLALTGWGGLVLSGPGAPATARAWLAALVTQAGPYGAQVIATPDLLDRLLPAPGLTPALRPVPDDFAVLRRLEIELIARTRRLEEADAADAAAYRTSRPEDPLPAVLALLEQIPPSLQGRWRAVLDAGRNLAIDALLVCDASANDDQTGAAHLVIDARGWVHDANPPALAGALAGTRLFSLDAAETADLLAPIAADHAARTAQTTATEDSQHVKEPRTPETGPARGPVIDRPNPHPAAAIADPQDTYVTESEGDQPSGRAALVTVQLLGPYRIWANGEEVATGLRSGARELLAWYLLRPHGAHAETAIEAIWPEVTPDRGPQRFWNALGNLRSRLRGSGDCPDMEVLAKAGALYRPQTQILDVDLWRFQAALRDTATANDPSSARDDLQRAVASYQGDLLDGTDYLWAEPTREDLHRRGLDAHLRLAELQTEAGNPEAALETLEHAIELDPLAEEAYRRLLTIQGSLHRTDAVRRTWRLLRGRLAELDLDPEPATVALYRRLTDALASSRGSGAPRHSAP